jgi:Holliday junction resolvase RusA-like endonuclease
MDMQSLRRRTMTFMLTFTVDGDPHGKGRPRFRNTGKFVQTYTDSKTKSYEEKVRDAAKQAMGSAEPLETPVSVFCYIRLPVPKSYPKTRREACLNGSERPSKKPDTDNVFKSVSDAMNGIVYKDDCQIVSINAKKVYSAVAGVDVMVREEID